MYMPQSCYSYYFFYSSLTFIIALHGTNPQYSKPLRIYQYKIILPLKSLIILYSWKAELVYNMGHSAFSSLHILFQAIKLEEQQKIFHSRFQGHSICFHWLYLAQPAVALLSLLSNLNLSHLYECSAQGILASLQKTQSVFQGPSGLQLFSFQVWKQLGKKFQLPKHH